MSLTLLIASMAARNRRGDRCDSSYVSAPTEAWRPGHAGRREKPAQIWTNLIDNALDAMDGPPPGETKALLVRTCVEPDAIPVEIGDNGPGIPPEAQSPSSIHSSPPSRSVQAPGWGSKSCNDSCATTRDRFEWTPSQDEPGVEYVCPVNGLAGIPRIKTNS
jgi:hypothetical protein